jgi:cytochrome c peroxidase
MTDLKTKSLIVAAVTATPLFLSLSVGAADLAALQELGKRVFWDNISDPPRMACVTCHDPRTGWTGSNSHINRTQVAITGANPHTVGGRKPPSNAYASFAPPFGSGGPPTGVRGGLFWDGRAKGDAIGDEVFTFDGTLNEGLKDAFGAFTGPTAHQALGPFVNPVEQATTRLAVCQHVQSAKYAELFQRAWTVPITCTDLVDVNYERIAVALAAWQSTAEVNSFSSKRDKALQRELDGIDVDATPGKFPLVGLTDQENLGHDLFYSRSFGPPPLLIGKATKPANCVVCHSNFGLASLGDEPTQLYTDFAYHNIGTPANPFIAQFDPLNPDNGLSGTTGNLNLNPAAEPIHIGHWKTTTLRNLDKRPNPPFVKAYAHNGWFKSIKSIVHFYNTATSPNVPECPPNVTTEEEALKQNCWPAPEHPVGAAIGTRGAPGFIGNLGLTPEEEDAIVAYMKTLTDTETPKRVCEKIYGGASRRSIS